MVQLKHESLRTRIDQRINHTLERYQAELGPAVTDGLRYSVLGPGKRVRPTLCLLAAEAAGGDADDALALDAAAALELVHAFSLIHDDLPELDDDDLRRGRPTLHRQTSHALALLAGDAAVVLATRLLAGEPAEAEPCGVRLGLVAELQRATLLMIHGQVLDTLGRPPEAATRVDAEAALLATHRLKTGALLRASVRMGAMAAGAEPLLLEALTRYGEAIGTMFQAVDDLLDVVGDAATLGKATGKDAEQDKQTYPGLYGVTGTRERIAELRDAALEALADLDPAADPLRQAAVALADRVR